MQNSLPSRKKIKTVCKCCCFHQHLCHMLACTIQVSHVHACSGQCSCMHPCLPSIVVACHITSATQPWLVTATCVSISAADEVVNDLEVLFIDEASMLSAELLQQLDLHLTQVRCGPMHHAQGPHAYFFVYHARMCMHTHVQLASTCCMVDVSWVCTRGLCFAPACKPPNPCRGVWLIGWIECHVASSSIVPSNLTCRCLHHWLRVACSQMCASCNQCLIYAAGP